MNGIILNEGILDRIFNELYKEVDIKDILKFNKKYPLDKVSTLNDKEYLEWLKELLRVGINPENFRLKYANTFINSYEEISKILKDKTNKNKGDYIVFFTIDDSSVYNTEKQSVYKIEPPKKDNATYFKSIFLLSIHPKDKKNKKIIADELKILLKDDDLLKVNWMKNSYDYDMLFLTLNVPIYDKRKLIKEIDYFERSL